MSADGMLTETQIAALADEGLIEVDGDGGYAPTAKGWATAKREARRDVAHVLSWAAAVVALSLMARRLRRR